MSVVGNRIKNDSEARILGRLLLGLYNTRIKNRVNTEEGQSFDTLKKELNPFIESVVIKYMTRSYIRGGQQVLDKTKIRSVPFFNIGVEGAQEIDNKFKIFLDKFWFAIEKIEKRNQPLAAAVRDIRIDEAGDVTQNEDPLDPISYIASRVLLMVVAAYNLGVALAPKETIRKLESSGGTIEHSEEITTLQGVRYRFVTRRDNKVDPQICAPLDGQEFDSNDPNLPNPPLHVYCRCILEIIT
jgi:hypothetical protein